MTLLHLTDAERRGAGVFGIQGDSGIGKSTLGRDLAAVINATFYETSNGFRGFAALVDRLGIDYNDEVACVALADSYFPGFYADGVHVYFHGVDVTAHLRSLQVEKSVATIAGYADVRVAFIEAVQEWAHNRPAIVVGRHIHEVYPDAQLVLDMVRRDNVLHFHRAREESVEAAANLAARTEQDKRNAAIALADTDSVATPFDTTGLTREEQLNRALELALDAGFQLA